MTTLKSPTEDLETKTLSAISGRLRKLEYLSGLRTQSGTYVHWGLSRVYGELAANKALRCAHLALVSEILSTPLRRLLQDLEQSSEVAGVPPTRYAEQLSARCADLLPLEPGPGSMAHFSSVLHALSGLAKAQTAAANHPTS